MFLILLFKKFKFNKYFVAIIYGFFYFFISLFFFYIASFFIKRFIISPLLFSLFVSLFMSFFFIFRYESFKYELELKKKYNIEKKKNTIKK